MRYPLTSLGCLTLAFSCPAQQLAWTQIKPSSSPAARHLHAMAYDNARQRTVLFGGSTGTSQLSDTWEWDGKKWTQIKPPLSLSARRPQSVLQSRKVGYALDRWIFGLP